MLRMECCLCAATSFLLFQKGRHRITILAISPPHKQNEFLKNYKIPFPFRIVVVV